MGVGTTATGSLTTDWNLDTDPLEALRDGDPGPFEAFVPEGLATLTGFFRRKGAGHQAAEDLAQDVLMRLVQHANHYEPRERFGAYVFRVARNAWIDDRRRAGARPVLGALGGDDPDGPARPEPRDPAASATRPAELADEADRVQRAVVQLSEAHREVFELGVVQELPYAEIGALLEIPVGTVKSRMFHALRALRGLLERPGAAALDPDTTA